MSHKRRKSDRRETVNSSDENNSEKVYYKEKHDFSDIHKKHAKHKKAKKASKYQDSCSDSEGDYDSRKENKTKRKHKKSSKEQNEDFETECSKISKKGSFRVELEKPHKSDKNHRNDISPRRDTYSNEKSRKRSKSQDMQRYGKWSDTTDKDKVATSRTESDEEEIYEISNKSKRNISPDNYRNRYEDQKKYKNSHRNEKLHNDDTEGSAKRKKKNKKDDKYREKKKHEKDKYSDEDENDVFQGSIKETSTYSSDKYKRSQENADSDELDERNNEVIRNKRSREYVDFDDASRRDSEDLQYKRTQKYVNLDDTSRRGSEGTRHKRSREYVDLDDTNRRDSEGTRSKRTREYVDADDTSRRDSESRRSKRTREYVDINDPSERDNQIRRHKRARDYVDLDISNRRDIEDTQYKQAQEYTDLDGPSRRNNDEKRHKRTREHLDIDDPNRGDSENASLNLKSFDKEKDSKKVNDVEPLSKTEKIRNINTRIGGAYIPPAKLRMLQEKIKDKSSEDYQRLAWEALKKSIVGMTNKVNGSNITEIVVDLFKENIIRGRGVLARAIMQAQGASPTFTRVYAALVAIINSKFPEIGELLLTRLILQYKRGFRRNDKTVCMTAARFLAHLFNQEVAHEVLILEIVTHLLENPTEDSVEIAIATLKECGKKLTQLSSRGMRAITQSVRNVLHEGNVDSRVRYMIEVFFAVQKDGFKDFEDVPKELDLVEEEDKCTHLMGLDEVVAAQEILNVFKFDPDYLENEEKYKSVVKEILGDSDDEEEEGSGAESGSEGGDEENEEKKEEGQQIVDMTETNIVCLRRRIYLTIQSSLDFEECAHKLLKLELKPGQILEMCYMILDCCAQQRTYEKFFGLLAQRFCQLNKIYVEPFTEIFQNSYKTIHRLETNKLRNVAKFFAHLLYTDAISWTVLCIIKLNEEDTTSSSRIFIKILFQELCEYMGLTKLNERVKDVTLQEAFDGLFPRDHPHNTRFAINFFTSIGLGGLTDELREHLKNLPKNPIIPIVSEEKASSASSASSSSSSSSDSE